MKINHGSVSRFQTNKQCPQTYKYKYHLELPSLEPEPIYFAYGSIIHKIAETYTENKGQRNISEIAEDVLSGKIPLGENKKLVPLTTEYRNKLVSHIRSIKKIVDQMGYEGHTEWEFNYDLDPPNKRIIKGFIDRLIQKNDKFWILDYKTTKKGFWRKGPHNIKYDLQLRTYARIVQKTFNAKPENIKAALYYLEGEEVVGACFTAQTLEDTEKELLSQYLEIENADPNMVQAKPGGHCARCDYRKICPHKEIK